MPGIDIVITEGYRVPGRQCSEARAGDQKFPASTLDETRADWLIDRLDAHRIA